MFDDLIPTEKKYGTKNPSVGMFDDLIPKGDRISRIRMEADESQKEAQRLQELARLPNVIKEVAGDTFQGIKNVGKTLFTKQGIKNLAESTVEGGIPSVKNVVANFNDMFYGGVQKALENFGADTMASWAKSDKEESRANAKKANQEVRDFIQKYDAGDNRPFMEKITSQGGDREMAKTLGTQIPTFMALLGIGLATRGASAMQTPALLGSSFAFNAGDAYQQGKDHLESQGIELDRQWENKLSAISTLVGVSVAPLDMFGLERILGGAGFQAVKGGFIKNAMSIASQTGLNIIAEGGTEGLQEVIQNAWAKTYNENQKLFEGVAEAVFGGGMLGGSGTILTHSSAILNGAVTARLKKGDDPEAIQADLVEATKNEENPITPEEAKEVVETLDKEMDVFKEDIVNKLNAGASPSEIALELSGKMDTQEAVDFVENVAKKAITETKQATTDAVAETQQKLDALMDKVSEAKTASQANKLLEEALEQGTITQKKLDRIRELVPALAEDKATNPTKVKQPTAKKPKEGKTPTGEEVKTAKKTLKIALSEGTKDVEVVEEGKIAGNDVFVHKNEDGTFSVSERKTGMLVSMKTHKNAKGAIKKAEKELLAKAGSEEALAKMFKERVSTKQHVNDVDKKDTEAKKKPETKPKEKKETPKKKPTKTKEVVEKTKSGEPKTEETKEDEALDTKDNKKDNKDDENEQDDSDSRSGTDTGGVPSPVEVGGGTPDDTGSDTSETGKSERGQSERGLDGDGVQSGDGLGTKLTNEEIQAEVEKYTAIEDGVVSLTKEVDEHVLEVANQYTSGGESKQGRGILDEYYTSEKIVDMVASLLSFPKGKTIKVLEPSVGTGNFLYAIPERDRTIKAHEINGTTARIAKIFHNGAEVTTTPFESNFVDERGNVKQFEADYDLVIGNPPYGSHRGKYLGLGEEKKISRYEDYFLKRGLDVLKKGGVLAMVVPSGFMRSQESHAKKEIAKMGKLVRAFRLPNGAFSSTDVGTDILIFEKTDTATEAEQATRLATMVSDGYFVTNPSAILGEQGTRKGRFGDVAHVAGTIDSAVELFEQVKNEAEAVAILKEAGITPTTENVEAVETLIEETTEETKDEAIEELKKQEEEKKKADEAKKKAEKKGKEIIKKKIVQKVKSEGKVVPLDDYFEGEWTAEELAEWADTLPDGSLQNPEKHNGNYFNGKYYNDFNYAKGDIYGKLDQLEKDKEAQKDNPKFNYEKQKDLLTAVLPTPETIENISISPDHAFLREYNHETGQQNIKQPRYNRDGDLEPEREEPNSLASVFSEWLGEIPENAFADSSKWEVRAFARGEKVTGTDKHRNEKVKERRERVANDMFKKFLLELPEDKKKMIENAYNRTYNSYYLPSFAGVPMVSQVNASMYPLKDSQKEGVGRAVTEGRLLMAHEVGFGKTTSGILTAHELIARKWAKRPLIVVPKPVSSQWVATMQKFLPEAKINNLGNLGVGFDGDLSSLNIEDGSILIITMEGFKRLGFTQATYNKLAMEYGYIASPQFETERKGQKSQTEAERVTGVGAKGTRADITFESLGVDALIVDEVQKANHIVSKAKPPKGTSNRFGGGGDFAQTPSSLGIKTWLASQYVQMTMGRNVFLLSATPFTNKPIEFFSILSLIGKEQLTRMGFMNVNNFFGMFFEIEARAEFKPDGSHDVVNRIRRIKNFRQWRQLLGSLVDFRLDDPSVIRPNKSEITYHIPTDELTREMFSRAQEIFTDKDQEARALVAIDQFAKIAFSPFASDRYSEKIDPKQYKRFVESSPKLKTMLAVVGQNKKDRPEAGQIIYSEVGKDYLPMIKSYLIHEMGYKESEVAIIVGGNPSSQDKVDEIQKLYNDGKIKVLIGNEKIAVGMNLQMNTTDMHLLTLPWNFLDLRQIHGRAWRQNNMWKNVRINYYLMQGSGDIHRSQTLANKQKLYDSAIASDANEVDIADVDHEAEALSLAKPEVRAKLELSGEIATLGLKILQEEAEIAFSTRKIAKINQIEKELKQAKERFASEDKQYKEAIAKGEEADDYWLKHYSDTLERRKKELAEELAKLEEKGVDPTKLLEAKKTAEERVELLKKERKEKEDSLDERIKALVASLPKEELFSQSYVDAIVADRAEANKTFYGKQEEAQATTVKVVKKTKEIKNGKGVVVKKKEKTEVVKTDTKKPEKKRTTKDKEMLKVLTDPNLSVKEKVSKLLDKKQEGKKYKDSGERVAGSKKENAVIQAVFEYGDDALLRQLATELGAEVLLAQLNKHKILEDVEVPTAEGEKKKQTPAFIANYKINVFNRIGRVPQTTMKSGRYSTRRLVDNSKIEDFVVNYPEALRTFVSDLNDIKTRGDMLAFSHKYERNLFDMRDVADQYALTELESERQGAMTEGSYSYIRDEDKRNAKVDRLNEQIEGQFKYIEVPIDVLGNRFASNLNVSNVSPSGKFSTDGHSSAYLTYDTAERNIKATQNNGVYTRTDTYYGGGTSSIKTRYYALGFRGTDGSYKNSFTPRGYGHETEAEARLEFETAIKENERDKKEVFETIAKEARDTMVDLNQNYDKFLPTVEMGKAKQIKDAEEKVKSIEENLDNAHKRVAEAVEKEKKAGIEGKTGYDSADYYRRYVKNYMVELAEAKSYLARLKGEEKAVEHGNFETIDEYDVKDSRFKKTFVNTENLMKVYGFKSAQLGNYMDDASSHEHVVQTMGAVEDMGKILKIDFPKMINSMGLSIAFGARGGGKFLAHFEPTHKIINITKKRGDGSFGHEFMHAMDWLLGSRSRGTGRWSSTARVYDSLVSDSPYYITKALVDGVTVEVAKEYKPEDVSADDMENDMELKSFLDLRKEGKTLEEAKATIDTSQRNYYLDSHYQALANAYRKTVTGVEKKNSHEYYDNSKTYGGGGDSYWVRREELWARAFQAYLEDKMEEAGVKNNYLTRSTKDIPVYPQGAERKEYNKMFDTLFQRVSNKFPLLPQHEEGSELQHQPRFKLKANNNPLGTINDKFQAIQTDDGSWTIWNNKTGYPVELNLTEDKMLELMDKKYLPAFQLYGVRGQGTGIVDRFGDVILSKGEFSRPTMEKMVRALNTFYVDSNHFIYGDGTSEPITDAFSARDFIFRDDLWKNSPKANPNVFFKKRSSSQPTGTDGYRFLIDVKKRLNLDFDVMWVDSILSQDGDAWGVTHDNAIAIVKNAPKWTAEHETVHLTTANLNRIPVFQRNGITREKLLTAQAQKMGVSATKENLRDIEEGLAEGFEQFMEGKSRATGIIRKFYNLLRTLVSRLAKAVRLTEGNIILDYYDILAFGEEVDNEMVVMERTGILEAFINEGTMTIPAIGSRFKLKDEKDGKVRNLKARFNDAVKQQTEAEAKLAEKKETVASEEDVHEYMTEKTKLKVSRKKLALLPAEIELIRKVVHGERVVVVKEVSRKLKVQRHTVAEAVKVTKPKDKKLVSAFQHRMMGMLDEQHQDDVSYNKMTKAEEVAKAEAYYDANKKRTLAIALGKEEAPADVSSNVIALTVIAKAQEAGDTKTVARVLPKLSLRATEQGQEISMLRDAFGASNPLSYMNKIIAQRKLLAKKKYKAIFAPLSEAKGFEELKEERVRKARKVSAPLSDLMTMKARQIDDFLADITC